MTTTQELNIEQEINGRLDIDVVDNGYRAAYQLVPHNGILRFDVTTDELPERVVGLFHSCFGAFRWKATLEACVRDGSWFVAEYFIEQVS